VPTHDNTFTLDQQMFNARLTNAHNEALEKYNVLQEKACGDMMLMPAGDAALFISSLSGSKPSTSKDTLCIVCNRSNHPLEKCYGVIKAKELRAEHQKTYNKDQCARRAAGACATAPPVVEAAPAASLRSSTPSTTSADLHCIADTGATSHMTPHCSWFVQYEPFVTPIRVANNALVFSEGVRTVVLQPTGPGL
jgi:hypothetical protein